MPLMTTSGKKPDPDVEGDGTEETKLSPYVASHAYSQLTEAIPVEHQLSPFILSFRRDVVAPIYNVLNQISVLRFSDSRADPQFIESMFETVRALERKAVRLLTYARETVGAPHLAEDALSLHSVTFEASLLAKAMFPILFRDTVEVGVSADNAIAPFNRHRITHFFATLLYFSTSVLGVRDVRRRLAFAFDVDSGVARWRIPLDVPTLQWSSFEELLDDPEVIANNGFEVNFIRHTARLLGASLTLDVADLAFVCAIPVPAPVPGMEEGGDSSVVDCVVRNTSPIVMSCPLPDGFTPVPGNVLVLSTRSDPFVVVEKSGARVFLANHTSAMKPSQVSHLINVCARMPIPVIFRSDGLDYDVFHDAKDFADAVLWEPCRRETLARWVLLLQSDGSRRPRSAEIHF